MGLACLDTELMLWFTPTVTGRVPQPRSGHSLCLLPPSSPPAAAPPQPPRVGGGGGSSSSGGGPAVVVMFGGTRRRQWLADVHLLRTDTYRWQQVRPGGTPPAPRSYHAAAVVPASRLDATPRLVVFGGNDGSRSFADVHVLHCG